MVKLSPSNKFQPQNFWGLTCILCGAFGLPVIIVGGQLAKIYGTGIAVTSVFIGNFVLWLIGFVIISMVEKKAHALENIRNYLGGKTGIIAEFIWIFAFLIWFVIQLAETTQALGAFYLAQHEHLWLIGVALGLLTATLCMGGISLIKRISAVGFPVLLLIAIYLMFTSSLASVNSLGIAFSGILSVILIWLPFTVNLPTIFRYSISKGHSIVALSLISISRIFFQTFAILINFDSPISLSTQYSRHFGVMGFVIFLFIIVTYTIVNMLNVYLAMPETRTAFFQKHPHLKYFCIGIIGTGLYMLSKTSVYFPKIPSGAQFFEGMLSSFIANLGIVLLFDFFIKSIPQHRPRPFEKLCSGICWLIGCLASVIVLQLHSNPELATFVGMTTVSLVFLIIIFLEETLWSLQQVRKKKQK